MDTVTGKLMKIILSLAFLLMSSASIAGAWTAWAVPVRVDVVRSDGIMVYGSFGNPDGCSESDQFFIATTHPQYNQIYAAVMVAMSSGRQIMAYADSCAAEAWYNPASVTYNTVSSSALNMQ
jgi:hypothetical protein